MAGELVLIIEDNERNLELLQDILEVFGFRTVTATSGSDGLHLARIHTPDLILMDIQLPDLDGVARSRSCDPISRQGRSRCSQLRRLP